MDYRTLGRSGLKVSPLCLGTMNFGPVTPAPDAFNIMDAAHHAGVNFFDTANDYGAQLGKGATEALIGDWFSQGDGRREKTVLATKLYARMADWPNAGGLSALNIRNALDASLKRLKTDYVDILYFHHIDRNTPWDEIWEAIEIAKQQGKLIYSASSNFAGWHIAQAQEAAKARNGMGLIAEQSIYNLLTRDIEREVIPAAANYGLGICPWSPLSEGLLAGAVKATENGVRRLGDDAAALLSRHHAALARYEDFADRLGHPPAALALAWLLHQPHVTAPIIGPRVLDHLYSAIAATEITLSAEMLAELDRIFPGYKTAPEDYAW